MLHSTGATPSQPSVARDRPRAWQAIVAVKRFMVQLAEVPTLPIEVINVSVTSYPQRFDMRVMAATTGRGGEAVLSWAEQFPTRPIALTEVDGQHAKLSIVPWPDVEVWALINKVDANLWGLHLGTGGVPATFSSTELAELVEQLPEHSLTNAGEAR